MTDLLTLIKKLLNQVPNRADKDVNPFIDGGVEYFYENLNYSIDYWKGQNGYTISLHISERNPFYCLNHITIEVSEKDYMEIKWKCEEWSKYLKEQQLNQFEEFVNGFENNSMDELLND